MEKVQSVKIFNVEINGGDISWFCGLPKAEKAQWVKSNTNQQNDLLIEEFLNTPLKQGDCGCGCGGNKAKSNEPNGIPKTTATATESIDSTGDGGKNSNKRQPKAKRGKN